MANAIETLDNLIREELPAVMQESFASVAPLFQLIERTTAGVQRDGMGRGWKVIHLFNTGIAGLIEYANPAGPGMITITGGQVNLPVYTSGATGYDLAPFPNAAKAPHTGSIKRELVLHMATGTFSVPITWMQADALDASQIKQVAMDIKAVGEGRVMAEAASFFSYNASDGTYDVQVLGRISSIAEVSTTNYVDIVIDEKYGRIVNFKPGMTIDIVATSTNTIQTGASQDGDDVRNWLHGGTYVRVLVTSVDMLAKTIRIVGINETTNAVAAYDATDGWHGASSMVPVAGDWIVLKGCSQYTSATRPMISWGLENWMKTSGYIMGGAAASALDLGTYPQFRSQVQAVNGPLTETVMNNYIGGYLDAYPGQSLDTLITTQGVTLKFVEQAKLYNNVQVFDRTGKTLSIAGGWDEVTYSFNGRNIRWVVSPLCLKGRLYANKMNGGNIKRYVPPAIGGKDARIGSEVEFLNGLVGNNIFAIARDGDGQPMGLLEAPYWQFKLIAPVDVRGVKLTDLTEATMT